MAATYSNMLALGTRAPEFTLLNAVNDQQLSLTQLQSELATVVMFICNHCPYVIHIQKCLIDVANHYQSLGVSFIAISSNDATHYPADAPDKMHVHAQENHFPFPYLYDESQAVAKAYQAACTPDFYVFDGEMKCVYRGRFDASTPGNNQPVTGSDLKSTLDALLSGKEISTEDKPSIGCNIKWKKD